MAPRPVGAAGIARAISCRAGSAVGRIAALSKSNSTSPSIDTVTASLSCRTDKPSWRPARSFICADRSETPAPVSDGNPFKSNMVACKSRTSALYGGSCAAAPWAKISSAAASAAGTYLAGVIISGR
ncbi:hypothetical protein G6F35_017486 [Rhizopus arrhizus]|nr:hypothetical protein G6F35_017486 [Rhizopus arrhizus]